MPDPNNCPPIDRWGRYARHEVTPKEADWLEEHLANCAQCLRKLKSVESQDELLIGCWPKSAVGHSSQVRGDLTKLIDRMKKLHVPDLPERISRNLDLICPHCHDPIAVGDHSQADELVCPSCGRSFLIDLEQRQSWGVGDLRRLGKFQRLNTVGRGAFGTVYRARDTELDRIVAVKVPHSWRLAAEEDEERFVREGRTVAQLRHPVIVPVFEVGRTDQFPYIVSEYVKGITLAELLLTRRLGFRDAAELVVQVAEALDHAHRQGVIHRDVKPSNIMLEATNEDETKGGRSDLSSGGIRDVSSSLDQCNALATRLVSFRPRLMDFGLARRAQGEITVTMDGQILGTPVYMSPEQARGEGHSVDGRSDIYSLGVILYELLTGEQPFRGSKQMLIYQVIHDEPQAPRKLNHRIPRDLETITLKCLTKSPKHRYATAGDLVADLRRWLAGQPVLARPVSAAQRLLRWYRRNPMVGSLAATLAVVFVCGFLAVTWQWRKAAYFRNRADANAQQARQTVYDFLTRVSSERLLNEPGMQELRRDLLQKALDYFEDFLRQSQTDPTLKQDVAKAYLSVAEIKDELSGSTGEALEAYQRARIAMESLIQQNRTSVEFRRDLGRIQHSIGELSSEQGRPDNAQMALQEAMMLRDALVKEQLNDPGLQLDLAETYVALGRLCSNVGQSSEGRRYLERALEIREQVANEHPDNNSYQNELARIYAKIADKISGPDALRYFQKSIDIQTRVAEREPKSITYQEDLASFYHSLGLFHRTRKELAKAVAPFRLALSIRERLYEQNPHVRRIKDGLAITCDQLAYVLQQTVLQQPAMGLGGSTSLSEPLRLSERARDLYRELVSENPSHVDYQLKLGLVLNMIALIQRDSDQPSASLAAFQEALAMHEQLAKNQGTNVEFLDNLAMTYNNMGRLHEKCGRWTEASQSYEEKVRIVQQMIDLDPVDLSSQNRLAKTYVSIAELQEKLANPVRALEFYEKARELSEGIVREHGAESGPRLALAGTYRALGLLHRSSNQPDDACRFLLLAVETSEKVDDRSAKDVYEEACSLAILASLAAELPDAGGSGPQKFADRAVQTLQQAVEQGFDDIEAIQKDRDLDCIRDYPGYKALIAKVGAVKQ